MVFEQNSQVEIRTDRIILRLNDTFHLDPHSYDDPAYNNILEKSQCIEHIFWLSFLRFSF